MAENDTLLAHLIPSMTNQVEVAATKALVFVLNKSESAKKVLNELVQETIRTTTDPVTTDLVTTLSVEIPFIDSKGEKRRLDLVGYDKDGENRVIGEAKFWADLREGQGKVYLDQLSKKGPAVLLFVVPYLRIDNLWAEVKRDVGRELDQEVNDDSSRRAVVAGTKQHLLMISWQGLLDSLATGAAAEPGIVEDIRQLQGLTSREDSDAFLPLHPEELSPKFARRMGHFGDLFVDAINRLVERGSINPMGPVSSSWDSCGRRIQLSGTDAWFGIHHRLWASSASEDTPLWLWLSGASSGILNKISAELGLRVSEGKFFPIRLQTGVERKDVLADVVSQLEAIADVIEDAANTPPAQPD